MNRHRLLIPALALMPLTALAACSGAEQPSVPPGSAPPSAAATDGGSASGPPTGPSTVPSTGAPTGASTGSGGSGSSSAAGPASSAPTAPSPDQSLGTPVARKTISVSGKKIELAVYPLVRRGDLSSLTMTLSSDDGPNLAQLLSDNDSSKSAKSPFAADGIRLVDPVNKKLYLVASASDGSCVCTELLGVTVDPGLPVEVSASFAPPAAGVTAVDVQVPRFGTFRDVPVG